MQNQAKAIDPITSCLAFPFSAVNFGLSVRRQYIDYHDGIECVHLEPRTEVS
jgi:hypothetical protein